MTRPTQGLLMAFLGAVLVRLAFTDAYLRYVTEWMKWPILLSGVLLVVLAVGLVVAPPSSHDGHDGHDHADDDGHGHGGLPLVTWLLVLPGLVTFVISPPQLGSYLAERRSGETAPVAKPADLAQLEEGEVVDVDVTEFIWRAQDGGETLDGQQVALTGFVSYDRDGAWYVSRLTIGCCAADAMAYQVEVDDPSDDAVRPPRDQWVKVTGTYASGTGTDGTTPPTITAAEVVEVEEPRQTYE
ncbi:TIGR03943 family protein [Nocardioides marinquilinus]|uniref:TIGR03943 family protein n=1 Tax=Nocardioides marinquilinus TaxID=1210400 RepID=A0ABP9PDQ9_9ACTN